MQKEMAQFQAELQMQMQQAQMQMQAPAGAVPPQNPQGNVAADQGGGLPSDANMAGGGFDAGMGGQPPQGASSITQAQRP